jgi:bacitracin synthase 3
MYWQSTDRLAEIIKREAVTVFFVTTALFNTLVDLDIGCLQGIRKILFGGEKVSVEHCARALGYLGRSRVIHVYGPTETTVYATYYFIDGIDGSAGTIPIGRPLANTTVYIMDRTPRAVPLGVSGELYIGGTGTARGYLNSPELTAEKFVPVFYRSYRSYRTYSSARIYKTGDLVRWLADGNIEFIGRIDHQVKIRGFRIELGEIESRLLNHDQIKEAVVLVREDGDADKYICAYIVPAGQTQGALDAAELREYLSKDLPDYMIPSSVVPLEKIPLTPNGKIDRARLPEPQIKAEEKYTAPRDEIEKGLEALWAEILGIDKGIIGLDNNFFKLGGHSLKATILITRIKKRFNANVQLVDVFKVPTVRGLARCVRDAAKELYTSIEPVEARDYYVLSSAQKRLYLLHKMEQRSVGYNLPSLLKMSRPRGSMMRWISQSSMMIWTQAGASPGIRGISFERLICPVRPCCGWD